MTVVSQINLLRARAIGLSREYKSLFHGDNGELKRSAEYVLADLRGFCLADRPTIFDTDPIVMARREGRRETFARIVNYLNLDEGRVQQLMELEDGN